MLVGPVSRRASPQVSATHGSRALKSRWPGRPLVMTNPTHLFFAPLSSPTHTLPLWPNGGPEPSSQPHHTVYPNLVGVQTVLLRANSALETGLEGPS